MKKEIEDVNKEVKKEKKKRKGLKALITVIVIIGIIILSLGFLFPGLIWTKSLGVTYTKEDYNSILEKLQYIKDSTPTGSAAEQYTYSYGAVVAVNVEFTSSEITAFFNENRPDYYAIKNVQVKVNQDGTIEASAEANVDYFLNEILGGNYSRDKIKKEIPALGLLPSKVNLYLNFKGNVTNNISSLNINSVSVQGIPIPAKFVDSSEAINVVTTGLNNLMSTNNTKTGSSFDEIGAENGKIIFKGKVPSSLERIKKND